MYIPYSSQPLVPLEVAIKPEATVDEVIGFALYEYTETGRTPALLEPLKNLSSWQLRIAEDEGIIDDDFPALDKTRRVKKYSFDQYALCLSSEAQEGFTFIFIFSY